MLLVMVLDTVDVGISFPLVQLLLHKQYFCTTSQSSVVHYPTALDRLSWTIILGKVIELLGGAFGGRSISPDPVGTG